MSCSIILKQNGLKLTPQRRLILDIIHSTEDHLTAEEIIGSVQSKMPGVNKSTVYRTLELLEGLNCVFKSEVDDKFIYHHADEGHHHHIVCHKCGNSVDCDENLFHAVEISLKKKYNFHADFRHIVVTGLCTDCSDSK